MKTLANPRDRQEIAQRLRTISSSSQRRWGRMTTHEMICHLSDAFRVSMGDATAASVSNGFKRSLFKWAALWLPTRWPAGVQTVPECDPSLRGTRPAEIEADMRVLFELFDRFAAQPRTYPLQPHPIFGRLTDREWMRWGYLHTDHHLRQFSA